MSNSSHEQAVRWLVEKAQEEDHIAQNVDRVYYSKHRESAFHFRRMARREATRDTPRPKINLIPVGDNQ